MKTIAALMLVPLVVAAPVFAESPEAYYLWATQQNRATLRAAYAKHDAMKARLRDRTVRGTRTIELSTLNKRFGGGVGYGNYGGQGGYAGYSGQYVGGGGFGFNYGYGFGQPGNSSHTGEHTSITAYEKVWHDEAWYGGAVTFLNPFCPPEE